MAKAQDNGAGAAQVRPAARRRRRCCWKPLARLRSCGLASSDMPPFSALQADALKYDHILLAIMDSNPVLSTASRTALGTAASLATQNASKL